MTSLLDKLPELRELEKKAPSGGWKTEWWEEYVTYLENLRNASPAMLEVLGCFQEGDAEIIREIFEYYDNCTEDGTAEHEKDVLRRLQKAAELMEKEE